MISDIIGTALGVAIGMFAAMRARSWRPGDRARANGIGVPR